MKHSVLLTLNSLTASSNSVAPSRAEITIYDYSNIVFTAIEGYLFLGGQVPDAFSILGYSIICLAALWMFIYNNKADKGLKSNNA